jgi:hypothetical protein
MPNQSVDIIDARLVDDNVPVWDGGFDPPDEGEYEVRVSGKPEQEISSNNNPMIVCKLEIVANSDGTPTPMEGRTLFARYVTVGRMRGRLKSFLLATGVWNESKGNTFSLSSLENAHLIVSVTKRPYMSTNIDTGVAEERMGTNVTKERMIAGGVSPEGDDTEGDNMPPEEGAPEEGVIEEEAAPPAPPVRAAPARTPQRAAAPTPQARGTQKPNGGKKR